MDKISFNDFEVGEKIGQGGFAEVYRARQQPIKRDVVLKVLRLELGKTAPHRAIARFEREAKLIASLEHPHIVPLYHFAINDDGRAYLVLRYMRGGTLADMLKRDGTLAFPLFERIARQIAAALDYAHSKGVIHRDVKPSNILLDEVGNAYLSDFGLARMMEISVDVSHHAPIVGTPTYASPEQLQDLKLDRRADLYSFGVVLYHGLIGRPPFLPSENGMMALIYHHLHDDPPPPSSLNPLLPATVDGVFSKALAKRPGDRYSSARQMVSDLCVSVELPPQRLTARRSQIGLLGIALMAIIAVIFAVSAHHFAAPIPGLMMGATGNVRDSQPTEAEIARARELLGGEGFIAYLACSQAEGYVQQIYDEMQRRADQYAVALRLYDANRDPALYSALADAAWSEGAKAFIVCHLSSGTSAQGTLQEAYEAGIPIVYLSTNSFNGSAYIEPVSAETARALGALAGEIVNRDIGGAARVVVLYYGSTERGLDVRDAAQESLLQIAPNAEIVASYPVMWENDVSGVIEALRGVDFDLILTINQRVSAPLADALAAAGYSPDDVTIVGLIADDHTRSYVEAGYFLRGGADINIPLIGQVSVDAAVKLLGGGTVPQTIRLPAEQLLYEQGID